MMCTKTPKNPYTTNNIHNIISRFGGIPKKISYMSKFSFTKENNISMEHSTKFPL